MTINTPKTQLYTKQGLWKLFLMCAFPLHLWTLLMAFRDISWLTERTNLWDAIGVASYGLVFAFVESVLVFVIAALLGLLILRYWDEGQRVALMSMLVLITALWSMGSQVHAMMGWSFPVGIIIMLGQEAHPVRVLYGISLILVLASVVIPTYLILWSRKAQQGVADLMERLTLLSGVYLFFDVIGLIIVIVRNV